MRILAMLLAARAARALRPHAPLRQPWAAKTTKAPRRRKVVATAALQEPTKELPPIPIELEDEMADSFMKYALSTILGRALPDARDGLKPVHRRILYAMRELKLEPNVQHRKCARVVGEVLGKFHPHGDSSVYEALVRMAQDFVMSERLVDGHGNFGSVDGDPPAAMRYTEARLTKFAAAGLLNASDLGQGRGASERNGGIGVRFSENFDASEFEPDVLPARLPVLLVNGAQGIAVGMATSIPPHNLGEVCDAALGLARAARSGEEFDDDALLRALPAPDFPTGGLIMGTHNVARAYATGSGSVLVRARTTIEKVRSGRTAIVATELPYLVSKSDLLVKTAEAVNNKKLQGVADLRDESGRAGTRVVFELKRDAHPPTVLANLFKSTRLQASFPCNWVAVDCIRDEQGVEDPDRKAPVRLTLRSALERWLRFRFDCVRRRASYEEQRAAARLHIVEGLVVAQAAADAVVKAIRASTSPEAARSVLCSGDVAGLGPLSDIQARAVLALTLSRLTSLAATELLSEQADLNAELGLLRTTLEDDGAVYDRICAELVDIKKRFATPRRSEIVEEEGEVTEEDTTPNERSAILALAGNYLKRTSLKEFAAQARGGVGRRAAPLAVEHLATCRDHDTIICITDAGVAYGVRAFHVPIASRTARGAPLSRVLPVDDDRSIAGLLPVSTEALEAKADYVVLVTKQGLVKRTPLAAFRGLTSRGLIAIRLNDDDAVGWAALCKAGDALVVATARGMLLKFDVDDIRETARATRGVRALNLREDDELAAARVIGPDKDSILLLTALGYGKRVSVTDVKARARGTMGVQALKFKRDDDCLVDVRGVAENDEVLLVTSGGTIARVAANTIAAQSRGATGVVLQKSAKDDACVGMSLVPGDLATIVADE